MTARRPFRSRVKPGRAGSPPQQRTIYERQNEQRLAELSDAIADAFGLKPAGAINGR